MKLSSKLVLSASCALMGFLGNISSAAVTTYTNRTSLEAALEIEFFNNFSAVPNNTYTPTFSVSSGQFSYTVSPVTSLGGLGPAGIYLDAGTVGVGSGNDSLVITFNTPTYGFGGQFYFVNFGSVFVPDLNTNLTITFSDNSTFVVPEYAPGTISNSYRGFVVDDGRSISKVTFHAGDPLLYGTLDNFTAGYNTPAPIPEPNSYATIAGLAGVAFFVLRRRSS
jgi:hypothetical protein